MSGRDGLAKDLDFLASISLLLFLRFFHWRGCFTRCDTRAFLGHREGWSALGEQAVQHAVANSGHCCCIFGKHLGFRSTSIVILHSTTAAEQINIGMQLVNVVKRANSSIMCLICCGLRLKNDSCSKPPSPFPPLPPFRLLSKLKTAERSIVDNPHQPTYHQPRYHQSQYHQLR